MDKGFIRELFEDVYNKGYNQGKVDAYAEMADNISLLARAAHKAIEDEIKEIKEKQ